MTTRLCTLLLLAALAAPVAAAPWGPLDDPAVRDIIAGAPAPAAGEDGLVLFEGRYYTHADGLTTLRHQRLVRVSTEWALERISDPRLRYDSSRQELEVIAARSYLPGGEAVDAPANALNRVTPDALTLAVDFLDIQELAVTHTALEPGVVVWLDYTLRDTAPAALPAGELIFPQADFPTLRWELIAGEGIFGEVVNPRDGLLALPPASPWQFENLPAAPGDAPFRLGDQLPHLHLSPQLGGVGEAIGAVMASLDSAMADTAGLGIWLARQEADRPFLSDREAIETWVKTLGESTALLRLDDWEWRRAPRSVARVLQTSVATPLERAALMLAALRSRDIDARLYFPKRWLSMPTQRFALPALDAPTIALNHPGDANIGRIDLVSPKLRSWRDGMAVDEPYFVDNRGEVTDRVNIVTLGSFGGRLTQYLDYRENTFRVDGQLGFPAGKTASANSLEAYLRDWLEGQSARIDALRLHGGGWGGGAMFDAAGALDSLALDEDGAARIDLPLPPVTLEDALPRGFDRSRSRLRGQLFPAERPRLHLTWILDLPEDLTPVPVPPLEATCPWASFTATRDVQGNRLTVHYDLEFAVERRIPVHDETADEIRTVPASHQTPEAMRVGPADYPAFREFVNAALDPAATRVILRPRASD
ncbi:MAG: DUF3857 domain-containing protein [Candidatus Latescibacteria bacterium]|nr:DUF3857 domain-containing protein [Candidatus Latescibacterota bacterium]